MGCVHSPKAGARQGGTGQRPHGLGVPDPGAPDSGISASAGFGGGGSSASHTAYDDNSVGLDCFHLDSVLLQEAELQLEDLFQGIFASTRAIPRLLANKSGIPGISSPGAINRSNNPIKT